MQSNYFTDRNAALRYLQAKYGQSETGEITSAGWLLHDGQEIPLLPWRIERRFIELKNLVTNRTLEDVSTLRLAHFTAAEKTNLDSLIYRQLDLCEWLGGSAISRLFAVFSGDKAANLIVKLENDISCSVECSIMLPADAMEIDRHEIIARRGVASDQVVDTQVPQSSIYTYTPKEEKRFTDVDAEVFGLSPKDVNIVRAAFAVVANSAVAAQWTKQHNRLLHLVQAAKECETSNAVAGENR